MFRGALRCVVDGFTGLFEGFLIGPHSEVYTVV